MRGKRRMHKTAAQHETAACLQWLEHEIALVAPKVVIALGATAARALLGRTISITTMRGHARPALIATAVPSTASRDACAGTRRRERSDCLQGPLHAPTRPLPALMAPANDATVTANASPAPALAPAASTAASTVPFAIPVALLLPA